MDIRKIEEIEKIQKEHLDEEFKQKLKDMTDEYEQKAMFYRYFGYVPNEVNNANKRKQESKKKRAKKRRIKRQSKRKNRR